MLQIIRDWFNTVNVKSAFSGQKNRDNRRLPIRGDDDGLTIRYLNDFRNWLENWKSLGKHGLSKPTFAVAIHTLKVIPALAILYNYAGYISSSLLKSMPNTCSACKDLLTSGFAENEIEIKDADCYDNTSAKDEFISIVARGLRET